MSLAQVSVIIPSYNSGHLVTQAVDSVIAQTNAPSEIIVVDDGSQDDTHKRLLPYRARIRYIRQNNQGVSSARNHGIRLAKGEFIAFLDADDVWHPRKLELQMELLRNNPELGLLGARLFDWPAAVFPLLPDEARGRLTYVSWHQLVIRNQFATSAVVVRKRVLDQAGPFDTRMQGPEDRDMWIRIAELTSLANLELPLTGYRQAEGSVSRQASRCEEGLRLILRKLDDRGAFRGRWLLRRKAFSSLCHSCSYTYGEVGNYSQAVKKTLASVAWYPFPLTSGHALARWARLKWLAANVLRLLCLKKAPLVSSVSGWGS